MLQVCKEPPFFRSSWVFNVCKNVPKTGSGMHASDRALSLNLFFAIICSAVLDREWHGSGLPHGSACSCPAEGLLHAASLTAITDG